MPHNERRIQRTRLLLVPPKRSPCCLGITEHPSVHARTGSTVTLPEREVWKGLCPFFSLADDVKRKKVGSSGLKTTDFEGVMSSALLKVNLMSGMLWLRGGGGLEKADPSFQSSLTPLFVSGTDLGLKAVPMLSNKAGSSVVKGLTGSPVSASGDTL